MLMPFSASRTLVALSALTVISRGDLSAQAVSYFDGTFGAPAWETVVVTSSSRQSVEFVVDGSTGNPFVRHDWASPQTTGPFTDDILRVAYINRSFTYDPALHGPLASLDFAFDYQFLSLTNFSSPVAFFRPVIRQSGVVYSVASSDVGVLSSDVTFTPAQFAFSSASNWVDANLSGMMPDFSANGSLIEFGYRFTLGIRCNASSCLDASAQTTLDNFSVTARPELVASVPEPSAPLLLAPAVLALAFLRRRRGLQS
jgi:MYXO-CTERM domain-containing protein